MRRANNTNKSFFREDKGVQNVFPTVAKDLKKKERN